jgi:hypothetical protein
MSYFEDRSRIRYEERLRQEAREDIQRSAHSRRQRHINKMLRNQRYVDEHGREMALVWTVAKWTVAGVIVAVLAAIGSVGEKGIMEVLQMCFVTIVISIGIGAWRGFSILQTTN